MLDKLKALSFEALTDLKHKVDEVHRQKQLQMLRPGREATFNTNKRPGGRCRIMITGRGPKNITGYEIDHQGNHLMHVKWRVAPSLLSPVLEAKRATSAPLGTGGDRPSGSQAGVF